MPPKKEPKPKAAAPKKCTAKVCPVPPKKEMKGGSDCGCVGGN